MQFQGVRGRGVFLDIERAHARDTIPLSPPKNQAPQRVIITRKSYINSNLRWTSKGDIFRGLVPWVLVQIWGVEKAMIGVDGYGPVGG